MDIGQSKQKTTNTVSIYDIYNDIIGYITKNPDGNIVRIFKSNIKQILD